MARRNCRANRDMERIQAEATAAAIIAQGREAVAATHHAQSQEAVAANHHAQNREETARTAEAMEEDIPMNRYIFPLPGQDCGGESCDCATGCAGQEVAFERVLETLCCQNQLLMDILGAVNALTASLLSAQCKR